MSRHLGWVYSLPGAQQVDLSGTIKGREFPKAGQAPSTWSRWVNASKDISSLTFEGSYVHVHAECSVFYIN